MTGLSAASVRGWREGVQAAAAAIVILGAMAGAGVYFTGGFRLNTDVRIDQVSQQLTQMQKQFSDMTTAFNDQSRHVDTRIGDMDERFQRDEININSVTLKAADVERRVTRLEDGTETNARNPHR